jgi:hypothetical protein
MESKKINQLATELSPVLSDLTIIGDPTTGISKKITLSQMASLFTGTVEEYPNLASFPLVGTADTIYIALDTNVLYRWNTGTNAYVELSPNIINSLVFNDANGFDGTISLVGSVATLTITTALTTGSVGFIGASGALLQDNANFFWDDTNNRLGLGTNAPTTAIDVFGSGIIGRLNGTSTNNAFLGFANAGTNRWSIGNVQSDHRFRIFSETNTSELVSVLQTGEFGIGIANPTTKFHIDGGASALIANLDANVSVAKSVSFRSDNSNRVNLEVSGTESGSNAGANFFLRTYTDLGALIETPFSIVRSTGVTTIKSLTLTNALSIANGGTGSTTQNFVDLTTTQSIGGAKTFTSALAGTSADFSGRVGISLSSSGSNLSNSTFYLNNTANTKGGIFGYDNTNDRLYINSVEYGVQFKPILFNISTATFANNIIINGGGLLTLLGAKIGGDAGGTIDFNYNTGGTPSFTWWGGTTSSKFSVTASGIGAFSGSLSTTGITLNDTSGTAAGFVQFQNNGVQKFNLATQATTNDLGLYNNGGTNSFNIYIKHSNGNVAIGSNNPSSKLTIVGTSNLGTFAAGTDTTHQILIGADSSYAEIQAITQGVGFNKNLILQRQGANVLIGTTLNQNADYRLSVANTIITKSWGGTSSVTTNISVPGGEVGLFYARGYNNTNGVAFSVVYNVSIRPGGGAGSDVYFTLISQSGSTSTFTFDNNGGFLRINPGANLQWSGSFFGTL